MKLLCNLMCQGENCVSHCCAAFSGLNDQLLSVEGRSFSDIVLTKNDYISIKDAGFSSLTYIGEDGIPRMKTKSDGECCAIINGKCSIYDVRPCLCRAFPLYIDMFAGMCATTTCPGISQEKVDFAKWKNELSAVVDIYSFWIEYYRKLLNETSANP